MWAENGTDGSNSTWPLTNIQDRYLVSGSPARTRTIANCSSPLLKQIADRIGPDRVRKVLGDRGYDSKPNYNYSEKRGITPTIRPRGNSNPEKEQPLTRKRLVKTIIRHGYRTWAKKAKYGLRWAVEGFFSAFKRLYGECLMATTPKGMIKEIIMKLHFYNKLINYKGPSQYR